MSLCSIMPPQGGGAQLRYCKARWRKLWAAVPTPAHGSHVYGIALALQKAPAAEAAGTGTKLWKRNNAAVRLRREYRSAEEVMLTGASEGVQPVLQPILDLRGPQVCACPPQFSAHGKNSNHDPRSVVGGNFSRVTVPDF